MSKNLIIRASLRTGKGNVRANNEDNYYLDGEFSALGDIDREKSFFRQYSKNNYLFAVCDGMGGVANGEIASTIVAEQLLSFYTYLEHASYAEALADWIMCTNHIIVDKMEKGGSTLALIYIEGDTIHISNIGDSRVYKYSNGTLQQLSKDHSKVQIMVDIGMITEEQAENHPHKNIITRYLGMHEEQVGTCAPYHAPIQKACDGDRYLICTDGISDILNTRIIENILTCDNTIEVCATNLYNAALQSGGKDNLTLIIIELIHT